MDGIQKGDVIRKEEYLVVQKVDGEQSRVLRLVPKQKVLIEKLKFNADSVIGQRFGLFEVINGDCRPLHADRLREQDEPMIDDSLSTESKDDEKLTPIAPSALKLEPEQKRQKMEHDEVLELKKLGATANELVAKLVQGSASFSTRTTYSQSKYIGRKSKKHSDRVLILRPTIRLLAKSYYLKDADRLAMLRNDQLGLILQMAGIHFGKKVVVFEQTLGLITSAVIERLAGRGGCVHIHRGAIAQSIPCVHSMNYTEEKMSTFLPVRIKCLLAGKQLPYDNHRKPNDDDDAECADDDKKNDDIENSEEDRKDDVEPKEDSGDVEQSATRRARRMENERKGLEIIENGAQSLIIASRTIDPIDVLEHIYSKLAPSATIVIYSPHMNILVDSYEWLVNHDAININITDQMCRIMQVLPDRTHPLMAQHVVGGNVLSAIKTDVAVK
ncbi:unnamed protein product [Caenorhabditis bovis]|uniref:tRNA (adenine(58)-N(1))-methyltransferase non-catalytic subunit TRM6 n=1 Tax=Caenorhabditis bovis TaxID=2654633 RepID=A0A8S1FAT5_9PELO|nr:unnamed protein product [Caenorhabditis bovis]